MRIAITADLHLDRYKSFGIDYATRMPIRLLEQQRVLNQIAGVVKRSHSDVTVIDGDIYHRVGDIPVEAVNVFTRFLSGIGDVIIGEGSHDLIERSDPQWFHSSVRFCRKSLGSSWDQLRLVNWDESEESIYKTVKGFDVVFLHKMPAGSVNSTGFVFRDGVDWKRVAEQNKLVFFAHVHHRQRLGPNCFVIGSPMHLNFGDSGDRGIYVIDTEGKKVGGGTEGELVNGIWVEFFKLDYPEFITVDHPSDVIIGDGNYYRVSGSDHIIDDSRVTSVVVPEFFEERIKSEDFHSILAEWLALNKKPESYMDALKDFLPKSVIAPTFFHGRLDRVHIKDFMSIGKMTLDINSGFNLVMGKSGDSFDSNGTGKTSIFDAIFWCLFRQTTKGITGNDVIRDVPAKQKDCSVRLELTGVDGTKYEVSRSRKMGLAVKRGGQPVFEDMREDDKQRILEEEVLGFGHEVFLASCYFSQESLMMLTGLSDVGRTNMITDLLGFERYDDLYEKCKVAISDIEGVRVNNVVDIDRIKHQIDLKDAAIRSAQERIQDIDSIIADSQLRVSDFKDRIKGFESEGGGAEELVSDRSVGDIDEQIKKLMVQKSEVSSKSDKTMEGLRGVSSRLSKISLSVGEARSGASALRSRIDSINLEIAALSNLEFGERCYKCGAEITHENADKFITEKQNELTKLAPELSGLDTELGRLCEDSDSLKRTENSLEKSMDELSAKSRSIDSDIERLQSERKKIEESNRRAQETQSHVESQIAAANASIGVTEGNIERLRADKVRVADGMDKAVCEKADFVTAIVHIEKGMAELQIRSDIMEFWKSAFSSKGIRTVLLDKFCNEFNVIVNRYLADASHGSMSVVVKPTKELKKKGEERNFIFLEIRMGNQSRTYNSLSGGEKRRVDIAICLALNRWVSNRYGAKQGILGIVIFDEVFSFVDSSGEEAVAGMLYNEGLDGRSVFVISHAMDLESWAMNVIKIKKVDGITSLISDGVEHAEEVLVE